MPLSSITRDTRLAWFSKNISIAKELGVLGFHRSLSAFLGAHSDPPRQRFNWRNLVEGCARNGGTEPARFCSIARGSASELEYHLLLAKDFQLLPAFLHEKLSADTIEIVRMLTVLIQKLTAES